MSSKKKGKNSSNKIPMVCKNCFNPVDLEIYDTNESSLKVNMRCDECGAGILNMKYEDLIKTLSDTVKENVVCDNHEEKNAKVYCQECESCLCSNCLDEHNKKNPDHDVKEVPKAGETNTYCQFHPNNPFTSYCADCKKNLCDKCNKEEHENESHDILDLKNYLKPKEVENMKKNIKEIKDYVDNDLSEIKDEYIENLDEKKNKDKIDDIENYYSNLKNRVDNLQKLFDLTSNNFSPDFPNYHNLHNLKSFPPCNDFDKFDNSDKNADDFINYLLTQNLNGLKESDGPINIPPKAKLSKKGKTPTEEEPSKSNLEKLINLVTAAKLVNNKNFILDILRRWYAMSKIKDLLKKKLELLYQDVHNCYLNIVEETNDEEIANEVVKESRDIDVITKYGDALECKNFRPKILEEEAFQHYLNHQPIRRGGNK